MRSAVVAPKLGWLVPAAVVAAMLIEFSSVTARAVMIKGSGDPEANTTAPAGDLTDSGWQYQGTFGSFLGTPISEHHFIAARHVGGSVGQFFTYGGVSYKTIAVTNDPETDLRIWRVEGSFPTWAPLYSGSDENGKSLVVMGRGTQRGAAVGIETVQTNTTRRIHNLRSMGLDRQTAQNIYHSARFYGDWMLYADTQVTTNILLKGWKAGVSDGRMRWGENTAIASGGFIMASFDESAGDNEAYLSGGDSSGAVFIKAGGVWKLAAINYGIQGPYATSVEGPYFYGAIFDKSGLVESGMPYAYPEDGSPRPIKFYATRISSRLAWITSIIAP